MVRLDDWPEIYGCPSFNPCNAKGLGEKPEKGYPYRPHALEKRGKGSLGASGYVPEPPPNGVLHIGATTDFPPGEKYVHINGVPKHQAAVLRRNSDNTWWVYDFGNTECGTFLNHRRVCHLERIENGDLIEVGGVGLIINDGVWSSVAQHGDVKIAVEGLSATKPGCNDPLLQDVSFKVRQGEFVGIIGPSGCGKSSLIQRLAGLAGFDKGSVTVNGVALWSDKTPTGDIDRLRGSIGYLPQNVEQSLHDELTLDQEIELFCRIHSIRTTPEEREKILNKFGLYVKRNDFIGKFSGGEKRRAGISLAMLRKPEIIFLDEPCAGLDPQSERELMDYVFKLCLSDKLTVLCVTHTLGSAYLFDRLLVLDKGGSMAVFDTPDEVMLKYGIRSLEGLYGKLKGGANSKKAVETDAHLKCAWWKSLQDFLKFVAQCVHKPKFGDGVFGGYWLRTFERHIKSLMLYVLQPLVIAVGIRLACATYFRMSRDGGPIDERAIVAFCATLSMFWIGINNSSRELVRERVPGRCLERLANVPLAPYLAAKFSWTLALCILQSLLFMGFLAIAGCIPIALVGWSGDVSRMTFPVMCWFPLLFSCMTGALCGLTVSAVAEEERSAVMWVPNIAILALLLSPAIMAFEGGNDLFISWLVPIVKFMPSYWPSKLFHAAQMHDAFGIEALMTIGLLLVYFAVSVLLVASFTIINERAWDGRGKR